VALVVDVGRGHRAAARGLNGFGQEPVDSVIRVGDGPIAQGTGGIGFGDLHDVAHRIVAVGVSCHVDAASLVVECAGPVAPVVRARFHHAVGHRLGYHVAAQVVGVAGGQARGAVADQARPVERVVGVAQQPAGASIHGGEPVARRASVSTIFIAHRASKLKPQSTCKHRLYPESNR